MPPAGCLQGWKHCLWLFLRSSWSGSKADHSYSSGTSGASSTGSHCISLIESPFCPTVSIIFLHLSTTIYNCSTAHAHLLPLQPGEVWGFIYIMVAEDTFFDLRKEKSVLLDLVCKYLVNLKGIKMRKNWIWPLLNGMLD